MHSLSGGVGVESGFRKRGPIWSMVMGRGRRTKQEERILPTSYGLIQSAQPLRSQGCYLNFTGRETKT